MSTTAAPARNVLELEDVHVYYGAIHALKGVSLTRRQGEIVTLIGANGAGQVDDPAGDQRPQPAAAGDDPLPGRGHHDRDAARDRQEGDRAEPGGAAALPAHDGRPRTSRWAPSSAPTARTSRRDMDRVFELFPRLYERRTQKAGTMSGGEQQMCAIGRALMARPKLLLLDEPSMGLAPIFVEKIFEIVSEINSQGTPVLLVEQNALMALDVAHRGYVMETGRITLEGPAAELKTNAAVQKAYLGPRTERAVGPDLGRTPGSLRRTHQTRVAAGPSTTPGARPSPPRAPRAIVERASRRCATGRGRARARPRRRGSRRRSRAPRARARARTPPSRRTGAAGGARVPPR